VPAVLAPTIPAVFVGTVTNVATVLAGTAVGAVVGGRLPERLRRTVLAALGLLTAALGVREILPTEEFTLVLAAILAGAVLGEVLNIEGALTRLGDALQRRLTGRRVPIEVSAPEAGGPVPHAARFAEGFVVASLVFCVGPLTLVGSIQDGLGDPEMLLVKAGLDGFASLAFASVYGWGVGLAALTVGVLQGGIAAAGRLLEGVLTDPMLDALGAAGGILLLGIALRLLEINKVRVANLLPAVALAPLFVWLWG
jgi:uncharacterized membrane protein YqgA involved in biofilm formation